MIALTLAATVAAVVTITLNAHHGFKASPVLEYAILLATLNAALDIAKCALIGTAAKAWRARRYFITLLSLLLFPPLFLNSVWNAVSQMTKLKDQGQAQAVADRDTRTRIEAEHTRLTRELVPMQASPLFTESAACAAPKTATVRTYCAKVDSTKTRIAELAAELATTTPADPEPQVTFLAGLIGWSTTNVRFNLALVPVILAEVLGSVGFYLASLPKPDPAPKASTTPLRVRFMAWLGWMRTTSKTAPAPQSVALATGPATASPTAPRPTAPVVMWPSTVPRSTS